MKEININPNDLADFCCPACGAGVFHTVVKLKHVPALLVGAAAAQVIAVPLFQCNTCNHLIFDSDIQSFKGAAPGLVVEK